MEETGRGEREIRDKEKTEASGLLSLLQATPEAPGLCTGFDRSELILTLAKSG